MEEISIILRNNILITIEEFRILDRYSSSGRIWTLINRSPNTQYRIIQRVPEYVLDPDTLTFFRIISTNVLAYWNTEETRYLKPGQEFYIADNLAIRPYIGH